MKGTLSGRRAIGLCRQEIRSLNNNQRILVIAITRKFLGIIYQTLKNGWICEDSQTL
jgi:hypothetical protein